MSMLFLRNKVSKNVGELILKIFDKRSENKQNHENCVIIVTIDRVWKSKKKDEVYHNLVFLCTCLSTGFPTLCWYGFI